VRVNIYKKKYIFNVLHLTDKNIKMFGHKFVVNENAVLNYKIINK